MRKKIEKELKSVIFASVSTEVINSEMGLFLLPIRKTAKS